MKVSSRGAELYMSSCQDQPQYRPNRDRCVAEVVKMLSLDRKSCVPPDLDARSQAKLATKINTLNIEIRNKQLDLNPKRTKAPKTLICQSLCCSKQPIIGSFDGSNLRSVDSAPDKEAG